MSVSYPSPGMFRRLVETFPSDHFYYVRSAGGGLTYVSPSVFRLLGFQPDQFLEHYADRFVFDTEGGGRPNDGGVGADFPQCEMDVLHENGSVRRLELTELPCTDDDGQTVAFEGVARDVTERNAVVRALRESEEKYRSTMEASLVGIYVIQDLTFCYVNETMARMFGYAPEEVANRLGPVDLVVVEDRERVSDNLMRRAGGEAGRPYAIKGLRKDGSSFDAMVWGKGITYRGRPASVGTLVDITDLQQAERESRRQKERLQVTLDSIGDAVITTNTQGCIDYVNPVAVALTGWQPQEAFGRPLAEVFNIIDEDTRQAPADPVARCLREGKLVGLGPRSVLVSKSGAEIAIEDSAAPIGSGNEPTLGVVIVFRDVTQSRRLSQKLSYQATHDELTGLINRREFEQRLRRALDAARDEGIASAICYLDLDQFKLINDTCGHAAGDALLRQVAKQIQELVRRTDTLARLGGDEFGLLMEKCSVEQAVRVARKILSGVSSSRFVWGEHVYTVSVSIGLASVDALSPTVESVFSAADAACYVAKDLGRNRIHIHQEGNAEVVRRYGEMQWAASLPRALEEDRFVLYCQPIVPAGGPSSAGEHYEILLRLRDEAGQLAYPGTFLPAAERYSLASRIDRWVIHAAFRWLSEDPERLRRLETCAINISGQSLGDEVFLGFVMAELDTYEIPGAKICFEITETVAVANLNAAVTFIEALKARGCRFALDDFGSGLSSFAYLKRLPVDYLKIDGFFVKDIVSDPMGFAIVKSINEIGKTMGKRTIAEFVENDEIWQALRSIGVDFVQGYGIGRPRPLA